MRAFCPGHITGFFTIDDAYPDMLRGGSRGAGFCVKAGATADVEYDEASDLKIAVSINGVDNPAPVTRRGIENLLQEIEGHIVVDIKLDAPLNQGFGLSSAGTFAACLALTHILDMDNAQQRALEATHLSEVGLGTGLGDAVAQSIGGAVIRETPGVGAFGRVRNFPIDHNEVCVCILGDGMNTEDIITSEQHKNTIIGAGNKCLEEFLLDSGFENFISLSNRFANETGLLTGRMREVLDNHPGKGSMVMLGNAVFAFGDCGGELESFGSVIRTEMSHSGARLVDSG